MKGAGRIIAWLTVIALCLCTCSGCMQREPSGASMLSVGYTAFSGVFSPFYAKLDADCDVVAMTQLPLLSTDRAGNVICNGIAGETVVYNDTEYTYNGPADVMIIAGEDGTVSYEFTLREDLQFSDGTPLTADDVIFTMYVLCDPMYDGPIDFASLPIVGLREYRAGMMAKWKLILQDTPKNAANGSAEGFYTAEEALSFWTTFNKAGEAFAKDIVDWYVAEELAEDVCTAAALIGYEGLPETATEVDLFNAIVDRRGYDTAAINLEQRSLAFEPLLLSGLEPELLTGVVVGEMAETIAGIVKTGERSLRVTLENEDTQALRCFCIDIAPKHYYTAEIDEKKDAGGQTVVEPGDTLSDSHEQHDERGFPKGDLTVIREKNDKPLGAGPYTFRSYDGNAVCFDANAQYYRGKPLIPGVIFKKIRESQMVTHLHDDAIDIAQVDLNAAASSAIEKVNGGVLNGDVLTVYPTQRKADGYVGMETRWLRVGEDASSKESVYLRTAFSTVFLFCGQTAVPKYYGKNPITTIKAPMTDIRGETVAPNADAVLRAVREYLSAAGYTFKDGKAVSAPAGAQLSYRVWFTGNAIGYSPAYSMMAEAAKLLEQVGISLSLRDLIFDDTLYNGIDNGMVGIWCAEQSWNDCALQVPLYQRNTTLVYRVASVDAETIARDITNHYGWLRDIEKLRMLA
ncbi:MAG: hypothetical protein IKB04_05990 [Clostridia bacterium]|nr:hypothetical protein [Clostridia bacterium]